MHEKNLYFFQSLYEMFEQRIMNYLISHFHDQDIAEEAFQETFITAYMNLEMLQNHPNPGGWLMTTAKNKGRNIRDKKLRRTTTHYEDSFTQPVSPSFTDQTSHLSTDDPIFKGDQYRPLRLKYAYGYSIHEIANLYQINESTCKMRLKRAKDHARKHLEDDARHS